MKKIFIIAVTLCFIIFVGLIVLKNNMSSVRFIESKQARPIFDSAYKLSWNAGFLISDNEVQSINQQHSTSTYGEILWESVEQLFNDIQPTTNDVVYELGCGTGKVCAQLYLTTPIRKIVGVELSTTRIRHALGARDIILTAAEKAKIKEKTWEYKTENLLTSNLDDATIVYSLTMFEAEVMRNLTEKLSHLKDGLRVITFQHLADHPDFTLLKTYHLPMSWNVKGSPVHLYKLKKSIQSKTKF